MLKHKLGEQYESPEIVHWHVERCLLQVLSPMADELTRTIWPVFENHKDEFSGTFLDVGCYGGWMLGTLLKHDIDVQYHGIDIWESAIEAARLVYGGSGSFEVQDGRTLGEDYDTVWCSQLHKRQASEFEIMIERLLHHTKKIAVLSSASLPRDFIKRYADKNNGTWEEYNSPPHWVMVYRVEGEVI